MKYLLTPLLGAFLLGLSGCRTPQPSFVRVEEGRFTGGGAPGYFIGANFWYAALLAAEGPSCDRDRLCRELDNLKALGVQTCAFWSDRRAAKASSRRSSRFCKPPRGFTTSVRSTDWIS